MNNLVVPISNSPNLQGKGLGWNRQRPDQRDFKLSFLNRYALAAPDVLPSSVDLRSQVYVNNTTQLLMPLVYDQGNLGSCTANAIAAAYEYEMAKQSEPDFVPSRLAIYWAERVYEHTTKYDAGAFIRDGFKAIAHRGVNNETLWPYDINKFAQAPPRKFWNGARQHEALEYVSPPKTLDELKAALASGFPFVFGFTVYDSFRNIGSNGFMPVPQNSEGVLGGHAVLAVGYHDEQNYFTVRNSWGTGWGANGYFYMPYEFILSSSTDDFWVLHKVK